MVYYTTQNIPKSRGVDVYYESQGTQFPQKVIIIVTSTVVKIRFQLKILFQKLLEYFFKSGKVTGGKVFMMRKELIPVLIVQTFDIRNF